MWILYQQKNLSDRFWYRKKKKTHDSGECSFASAENWFEDNISQKSEDERRVR